MATVDLKKNKEITHSHEFITQKNCSLAQFNTLRGFGDTPLLGLV